MLHYVYRFNTIVEDWECVGAFSKIEEANARAGELKAEAPDDKSITVIRLPWERFVENTIMTRLGKIAGALDPLIKSIYPKV